MRTVENLSKGTLRRKKIHPPDLLKTNQFSLKINLILLLSFGNKTIKQLLAMKTVVT